MGTNSPVTFLQQLGCCTKCVRIFCSSLSGKVSPDVKLSDDTNSFEKISSESSTACKNTNASNTDGFVCSCCLGLLQENCCSRDIVEKVCASAKHLGYDSSSFTLSVSLPLSCTTRCHVIAALLTVHCGFNFTKEQRSGLVGQLKEAWKQSVAAEAADVLGKSYVGGEAELSVPVAVQYPFDAAECNDIMIAIGYTGPTVKIQRSRRQRKFKLKHIKVGQEAETEDALDDSLEVNDYCRSKSTVSEFSIPPLWEQPKYSRMAIEAGLSCLTAEDLLNRYSSVPPVPAGLALNAVTPIRSSVFIAGRYRKYSRELSQTPWVFQGQHKTESSVEEIIGGPVQTLMRADELKFISSGREDVDVRCLGRGRPFALEVLNPRRAALSQRQVRQLQDMINSSTNEVSVSHLQIVNRDGTSALRYNSEEKTKSYCALCVVRNIKDLKADLPSLLLTLQDLAPLTIQQQTPLRVLHRRTLLTRSRCVYSLSTESINDEFFKVYMRTEAGTYIKEFVHGDLGRTVPNLSSLLKADVDILALDVVGVELDWPPSVVEENTDDITSK